MEAPPARHRPTERHDARPLVQRPRPAHPPSRRLPKMPADLTSEETIALLDASAHTAGAPTLSLSTHSTTPDHGRCGATTSTGSSSCLGRYPNCRAAVTARTHYVGQVIPRGLTLLRFEHTGFEGVEFEAVSEYANHYGLEPPTSPPIHGEVRDCRRQGSSAGCHNRVQRLRHRARMLSFSRVRQSD